MPFRGESGARPEMGPTKSHFYYSLSEDFPPFLCAFHDHRFSRRFSLPRSNEMFNNSMKDEKEIPFVWLEVIHGFWCVFHARTIGILKSRSWRKARACPINIH